MRQALKRYVDKLKDGIDRATRQGAVVCVMEAENTHDVLRTLHDVDLRVHPPETTIQERRDRLTHALATGEHLANLTITLSGADPFGLN